MKMRGIILALFTAFMVFIIAGWFLKGNLLAEDEVYILPNNFTGAVIILMNEHEGEDRRYDENGSRIYEIPKNGILKTQFKQQEGWRDIQYKRINGQELRYLWPSDRVWDDKGKMDSLYGDSVYVFGASSARDRWFVVGHAHESDSLHQIMSEQWDSIHANNPDFELIELEEGEKYGEMPNKTIFDD